MTGDLVFERAAALFEGGPGADWHNSPGAMACTLDRRTVQRAHLALMDQAFLDVAAGRIDRILITTPPQVGKSSRVVWAAFWWLTRRPDDKLIVASYGAELAAKRGRAVRNLIRDHGHRVGLSLASDKTAANDWALTGGGGMRTGGIDSGLTGEPADLAVIDDPVKNRVEADSPTVRNATWDWYSSTLLSRLSPSAPLALIQTRWHEDDLAGRVLAEEGDVADGGRWHVLHVPALADWRFGPDPLGRGDGAPLPHPKIPEEDVAAAAAHWAEKRRTATVRDWAALYQGDPVPLEGALLSPEMLAARRHYGAAAATRFAAVAVDPSGGGRDEAGIVGGFLGTDGRLYWTQDRSGRMPSEAWGRAACQLAREIGADRIVAEQTYGGDMVRLVIRTAWDALSREAVRRGESAWGFAPRVQLVHSKRGKLLRAEPIAQQLVEDRIRLAAPLLELEREWLTWRPDSPWSPGRIDASVHLAYALLPVPGAESVVAFPGQAMAASRIG